MDWGGGGVVRTVLSPRLEPVRIQSGTFSLVWEIGKSREGAVGRPLKTGECLGWRRQGREVPSLLLRQHVPGGGWDAGSNALAHQARRGEQGAQRPCRRHPSGLWGLTWGPGPWPWQARGGWGPSRGLVAGDGARHQVGWGEHPAGAQVGSRRCRGDSGP